MAAPELELLAARYRPGARARLHLAVLLADAEEHVWRRRLALHGFRQGADWEAHIGRTRERFRAALGPLPERSPLRVTTVGVLARRGYAVEKLVVETQPSFFVTANLYLPAHGTGKAPAILNPSGHWSASKAEPLEQARYAALARKGYVALAWDPLGQGERLQYPSAEDADPRLRLSTAQHAAVGNAALLIGATVIAPMVWDGVRLLDYLLTRPEVDPDRIGCTGVSGGGTFTMFLGAFDERIKATVPVCSTSSYLRMHAQGQIGETCQAVMRSYPDDLDMADLLMCHAPGALLLMGTRYDAFPLGGLRDTAYDVQRCYEGLGIPDRTALAVVDAHHDYNQQQREVMYAWFNRWLEHDAPVAEEPFEPEAERTLWCTSTGQVLTSLGGKSAPDLVRDLAAERLPGRRACSSIDEARIRQAQVRAAVRAVLGPLPALNGAPPTVLAPTTVGGCVVERLILQARMDMPLPALLFQPPGPVACRPAAVLLDDRGKAADGGTEGLAVALARAGIATLAVDLRGWGETAWVPEIFGFSPERRDLLGAENMLSYISYLLGHSHVAQRVQDTLGVLAYLRSRPDIATDRLTLIGRGGGAVVALHAAALDGALHAVATYDAFATYRSLIDAPWSVHPVADFLPGVLLHYDLPELAAALAPTRVLHLNPQDARGEPLSTAARTAAYGPAAELARALGGELRAEAPGNAEDVWRLLLAWT
ncbi:MAG: acetylxylan esterase [Chloroflexota bacterium]